MTHELKCTHNVPLTQFCEWCEKLKKLADKDEAREAAKKSKFVYPDWVKEKL